MNAVQHLLLVKLDKTLQLTAYSDVQVPMTVVQAANLMAIDTWYGNLMVQAKSSRVRKRTEPQLLAKQKRWMDGQQMLQVAHQFLLEGELSCRAAQTSWITSL